MSRSIIRCADFYSGDDSEFGFAPGAHRLMSLRPAIPGRVALLHCPPPLHQPISILKRLVGTVNHHLTRAGEFSTGDLGNFQPELTPRLFYGYTVTWTGGWASYIPDLRSAAVRELWRRRRHQHRGGRGREDHASSPDKIFTS